MLLARQCILKNIRIQRSYRFDMILRLIGILLQILLFYFIGKLVTGKPEGVLAVSNGQYFPFVLVGLAFTPIFSFGLSFCTQFIREETGYGTIGYLFTLPASIGNILVSAAAGRFIFTIAESGTLIILSVLFCNITLTPAKVLLLLIIFIIAAALFFGIGLVAGSFVLIYKRGDPVQWLLINLSDLLGGVYFPVAIFPSWLKGIAFFIPTTHILNIARKIFLAGQYTDIAYPLAMLTLVSGGMLWIGLFVFKKAFNKSRQKGTLGHF